MAGTEQAVVARLRTVPALLVVVVVLALGGALGSVVDAVSDVHGQRASDAGELVQVQKYLTRTDSYHDFSETEFRLTDQDSLVPGQLEVGDVPGASRLPGGGEVTAYYYADELVALRLDNGMTLTSTLFGLRGAVASFLLAAALLLVAVYAALVLRGRSRPGSGTATAIVVVSSGLSWVAVVSALPLIVSVVLIEGVGLVLAHRALAATRRAAAAPS